MTTIIKYVTTKVNLLLQILSALLININAFAQQPGLDHSFGDNGIIITQFGNSNNGQIYDLAIQPDHKIIASGFGGSGGVAVRYLPDGSLDETFAKNGIFTFISRSGVMPTLAAVILQPNGKILLGGNYTPPHMSHSEKFLLIRLLSNGRLDPSFGTGGVDTLASYYLCTPKAMAVQPDGKILLGGHYSGKIALARYMPNGGLDSSFGDNGMALIDNGPYGGNVYNIEFLPNSRILLGGDGYMEVQPGDYRDAFMLTRLRTNGSLDNTFNHTGQVYHRICNCYNYGEAMKLLPNGKILMAGYSDSGNLLRLNADGSLDTTFNHTGIASMDSSEIRANIIVGPDGKIWIGGTRNTDFAVYRFLPEGTIDTSFGTQGRITTKIQRYDNRIYALALQADGKVVAGGYSRDTFTTPNQITLVRYMPDGKTNIKLPKDNEPEVKVYPNPANTHLLIENNSGKAIKQVTIYTADGRKVFTATTLQSDRIPLKELAEGNYTLHILLDSRETIIQKITILKN